MSASTKVQSQAHKPDLPVEVDGLLAELRVGRSRYKDGVLKMRTPITGETIGQVQETSASEAIAAIEAAHTAFRAWRLVPAPKRGELVRLLGEELRAVEASDPEGLRYPRFKRSDDATALLLALRSGT